MKYILMSLLCLCFWNTQAQNVITEDIDNFWKAYDKITATKDNALQRQYLNQYFLNKATPGLTAIRKVRNYTPQQYLDAINRYPKFWQSIRANTYKAKALGKELEKGIQKLKKIYPTLKPANIYFTVGAFRTNGTTLDSMVLIGSELAMADKNTITNEFPARNKRFLDNYFSTNPIANIVFLNIHEYVHTQQTNALDVNLLTQCLREGVAEFVAVVATGEKPYTSAIPYGKQNEQAVKKQFKQEMFNRNYRYWLWSSMANQFKTRDLGYYIGYAIAEKYYQKSKDKQKAIAELVRVNLLDKQAVETIVNKSGYFSKKLSTLKKQYEQNRPQVVGIRQFKNGSKKVSPDITQVTVTFSKKMNTHSRGFELGPLGKDHVMSVNKFLGFYKDGKSVSFEVKLQPNKAYQLVLSNRFCTEEGTELLPYLIDIRTGE